MTALGLLWLSGAGLRLTLLCVPPVIPLIHAELGLSETEIGTLGTLPSLLFAAAAIPGSLLIARFGATTALVIGLLLVGFGSAARGAASDVGILYLTTMITSAGIAIMQPAMPPLVRSWLPDRVPFATAVYTNGLLVAEVVAVALTLPLVLPLAGGSWRMSFVLWGIPVIVVASWSCCSRRASRPRSPACRGAGGPIGATSSCGAWRSASAVSIPAISPPIPSCPIISMRSAATS